MILTSALEDALSAQSPWEPCKAVDTELAVSALYSLDPRRADIRSQWLKVAAALKSFDDPALFQLWITWSRKSHKFKSVDDCRNTWASLDGSSPEALFKMAREDGWLPDTAKPEIVITPNESRVVAESVAAIGKRENLYQRGNFLVRVTTSAPVPEGIAREADPPRIVVLPRAALRECLAASAHYVRETKDGKKPAHIPEWLPSAVEARDSYHNPTIEAVTEVPLLRSDGSVIREPGFDVLTGSYFAPSTAFPIVRDTAEARDALLSLAIDFPWKSENDRSAWFASVLTPPARLAFDGPAPLNLCDSNTPGSGKLLLVNLASLIGSGRLIAVTSAPESDAEWRKRITSIAIAGEPLCLIDNVSGKLASPSLDAALTATTWRDRVLGESKTVTLPLRVTFYATGNNVVLHRDTFRRTNYCRLESTVENPETRSGFKYPSLLNHVRENRGYLTACALAILQGYCRAGRPNMGLPPLGSFEGWSDLVRSAVVWCGLPDPISTRAALVESDDESALLRQLLAGWKEADSSSQGMTAAEAIARGSTCPTLYAALQEMDGGKDAKHALGLALRKYRGRICDGQCFAKGERGKTSVWKVVTCNA